MSARGYVWAGETSQRYRQLRGCTLTPKAQSVSSGLHLLRRRSAARRRSVRRRPEAGDDRQELWPSDDHAYPGSTVLKNRLNIQDQATLDAFEVEITTLRAEEPLPTGAFDSAHYQSVHHHLFQDVYEWAGQYRTVRIAKGSSVFCYPENIPAQMDRLFRALRHGGFSRAWAACVP